MYTLEKVASVEKMLISPTGTLLDDCHFYQGRDKNSCHFSNRKTNTRIRILILRCGLPLTFFSRSSFFSHVHLSLHRPNTKNVTFPIGKGPSGEPLASPFFDLYCPCALQCDPFSSQNTFLPSGGGDFGPSWLQMAPLSS